MYPMLIFCSCLLFTFSAAAQMDTTYYQQAKEAIDQEDYTKGFELLDSAIMLNSTEYLYYNKKAFVFHQLGKYEEAIACINEGIEKNPTNGYFFNTRALINYYSGQFELSIEDTNRAMDLVGEDVELKLRILINRSNSNAYLQNYSKAIEDLKMALGLDSKNGEAMVNLGTTYMVMGEHDLS
jgi:tetratricopeptide (TPR) repeat protein